MDQPFTGKNAAKPRILVAPLDWGLGHATRCIPLIRLLLQEGAEVVLAGEGAQQHLLTTEFPQLPFLPLTGYHVRYSSSGKLMAWQMLLQSQKLFSIIKKEHKWLQEIVATHKIDAVISDNRFGLYHPGIPCVFITHQLTIKSPFGKWTERLLQKRNYKYINRFTQCWVPDNKDGSLAGDLSHPAQLPAIPVQYTGTLSRFQKNNVAAIKDHLLIVLSGPEPQRTLLENILLPQVSQYNGTATVVRGLPGNHNIIPSTNMIRCYNHLSSGELNIEMEKADFVISRSGYSTVMDLAALQKKSILIPTPGQTEQEYLGDYLSKKGWAAVASQKEFSLIQELEKAKQHDQRPGFPGTAREELINTIKQFVASLRQ